MAAVSGRIGGKRFAKNGQIMILAEQLGQLLGLVTELVLGARPRGPEKLQLTAKMPDLFTPFVEILNAWFFCRQSERVITCAVYASEAALHGSPTFKVDPPICKPRQHIADDIS